MSKSKENEAPDKVFAYLKNQNRPYSAGDVFMNLHKEFSKPCIQRGLDQLVSKGTIKEKAYGKQKVYSVDQSIFPSVDEKELRKMDDRISELQGKVNTLQSECQAKETRIKALESSLTLTQAKELLASLEKECDTLGKRLDIIKKGADKVTPAQSEQIRKTHQLSLDNWRKRKRMSMDIVNSILEGYPKSKKDLMDEIGMETDDDCGVVLPPK